MYTIQEISQLAGVSSRTLRYYDQIGLLVPKSRTKAGVRMYATDQIDRLQRILFFKTLNVPLKSIKEIMQASSEVQIEKLHLHQAQIEVELQRLQNINTAITSSIRMMKGELTMTDSEKFKSFKEQRLVENEAKFGNEIREKYGEDTVERANQQFQSISEKQMQEARKFEADLVQRLQIELQRAGDQANRQQIFKDHQAWLKVMTGSMYSVEYHHNLGLMYQADQRFQKYYDDATEKDGAGMLLSEIILEATSDFD